MTDRTDGAPSLEEKRHRKLASLAEIKGFDDVSGLLTAAALDCVCPTICINPGCEYAVEMEPDQREGCCEAGGIQTVQSALVLADLI